MVTMTFNFVTLLIGVILGLFVGTLVSALAFCRLMFDERWRLGFSEGWDAKKRDIEKQAKVESDAKPM